MTHCVGCGLAYATMGTRARLDHGAPCVARTTIALLGQCGYVPVVSSYFDRLGPVAVRGPSLRWLGVPTVLAPVTARGKVSSAGGEFFIRDALRACYTVEQDDFAPRWVGGVIESLSKRDAVGTLRAQAFRPLFEPEGRNTRYALVALVGGDYDLYDALAAIIAPP